MSDTQSGESEPRPVTPYVTKVVETNGRITCVYLGNGQKISIARDGNAAWLEIKDQATIRAMR